MLYANLPSLLSYRCLCYSACLVLSCFGATVAQAQRPSLTLTTVASASPTTGDSVLPTSVQVPQRKGSWLRRAWDYFNSYDSLYIDPNHYDFTVMAQNTNTFDHYVLRGMGEQGQRQTLSFSPTPSFKVGPYFGWKSLFLGYTFDIAHIQGGTKKTELNLNLYSALLGLDFIYKKNSGAFNITDISGFDPLTYEDVRRHKFPGMQVQMLGINVYYIFNHKRFSYPAAYNQSTRQIRSAGGWKLGVQFAHQRIKLDYTQLPDILLRQRQGGLIDEIKVDKIQYYDYSINFGYAYNWVFARNWVLAGSVSPAIGCKHVAERHDKTDDFFSLSKINVDLITRLGIVWNNQRYFAGASFIQQLYDYRTANFSLTNTYNVVNVYVGLYFGAKHKTHKPRP